MRSLRPYSVYVETTVWNFSLTGEASNNQKENQIVLTRCRDRFVEPFISDLVLAEMAEFPQPKRTQLCTLVKEVKPGLLYVTDEACRLSQRYIDTGVVPAACRNEALHVAIATVENIDILTSWDFRHIVGSEARQAFQTANVMAGYKAIDTRYPMVLLYEGDD